MKQYQVQFWKLLLILKEEYFPRYVPTVDVTAGAVVEFRFMH